MKTVILKIVIAVATIALVSAILLVSIGRPVHNQKAELDVASAYSEPQPLEYAAQPGINVSIEPPELLPNEITQTPERFLAYFETQKIDEAYPILLTDEFLVALQLYQQERFAVIYAYEELPLPIVSDVLMFMERAVGGNYIFGGQGNVLTKELIDDAFLITPDYFDAGRFEYFYEKSYDRAARGVYIPPRYPQDYAWDCSGLLWDSLNTLEVFEKYTDKTANATYEEYCTPITKEELQPGDLVFYRNDKGNITHMGIVGYDGYVYEAASGFVGVVKTQSLDVRIYKDLVRGGHLVFPLWNEFGRPNFYE